MRVFQVDAFSAAPFRGNPAGVCLLDGPVPDGWMQDVAAEMNLSETAFHLERDGVRSLRWFTPVAEVELCGHATLATAHVLFESGARETALAFSTASGILVARRDGAGVELDFPSLTCEPVPAPDGLADALGAEPRAVSRVRRDLLVELSDEREVRSLRPDPGALRLLDARGVIVTAASAPPDQPPDGRPVGADAFASPGRAAPDFVSRFFAPGVGIDEDPVTGAAHCALAPYWAARLGRTRLLGEQASRRGGFVRVRLSGGRVLLGGEAVTVLSGELHVQ
ncbi:MAG: PhzF family phenazine biosynthesis protein [Actinomycetota bacterium]|nr:PhzF family phenazine biosynthesis protein [Actinomycetota bacterium]